MTNMRRTISSVIIDDESAFINTLNVMIKDYPQFQIVGTARSVEDGISLIQSAKPDIVFLDIQLGDGLGFDVLRATHDQDFLVIFCYRL